jgi:hypothetical protein
MLPFKGGGSTGGDTDGRGASLIILHVKQWEGTQGEEEGVNDTGVRS